MESNHNIIFTYIIVGIALIPINCLSQGINTQSSSFIQFSGAVTLQITDGNFVNNGTYTKGSETLIMTGTSAGTMSGANDPSIYKLQIKNTGGITTAFNQLTAESFTINNGAKFTINPDKAVLVSTTLTNNAGTSGLIIKSSSTLPNGSLIFFNAQESPVSATVEMYSKANWDLGATVGGKYKWQFFGSPVKTTAITPTFDGAYIRKYNEAGNGTGYNTTTNRWIQLVNGNSITENNGYEIVQAAAKTYSIQGELINNSFSKSLSYTIGADYSGQHMLGNPYTAAIDIKEIEFGTQTEASIYQYNTGSLNDWQVATTGPSDSRPGQYTVSTIGTAGDVGIPRYIPSMQGFLVKAMSNSVNATISIPYASVSKNTTAQRTIKKPNSYITIDVNGERFSDKMWIYSNTDCTRNFDNGWDGRKIYGSSACPQLYGSEADDNYQIDVVDDINNTTLGFIAGIDTLYTLTFTQYNIAEVYPGLYLLDLQTNTITDISLDKSTYRFKASNTLYSQDRFKIVTNPGQTTKLTDPTNSNQLIYYSNQTIFIQNKLNSIGNIDIMDLSGKVVEQHDLKTSIGTHTYPTKLKAGIYICSITTNQSKHTKPIRVN